MLDHILNGLGAVGNALDLPSSMVRDTLAGQNPFDQILTPFHDSNRTSGRDLLRHYGLASHRDTWGNFAGGLAAETLLDPLNAVSGFGLGKTIAKRAAVRAENTGIHLANSKSFAQRQMGFFPEENIAHLHPALTTTDPITGALKPKVMYHGTPHVYDNLTEDVIRNNHENLHGAGHYVSDSQIPTAGPEGYWTKDAELPYTDTVAKNPEAAADLYKRYYKAQYGKEAVGKDTAELAQRAVDEIFFGSISHESPRKIRNYDKFERLMDHHIKHIEVPGSPSNVRMAHFDIRNPFDIDAMHNVADLKIPEKLKGWDDPIPSIQETLKKEAHKKFTRIKQRISSNADEIRQLKREVAQNNNGPVSNMFKEGHITNAQETIKDLFANRPHPRLGPEKMKGDEFSRFINYHLGQEHIQDIIRNMGHDAIVHTGGVNHDLTHQVAIAYHPSQEYKPYIAKAYQKEKEIPKITKKIVAAGTHAGLSRGHKQ